MLRLAVADQVQPCYQLCCRSSGRAGDAAGELPTQPAIVSADLHSLVFQRDYRLVPATTRDGSR